MNRGVKIALYVALVLSSILFSWQFRNKYELAMTAREERRNQQVLDAASTSTSDTSLQQTTTNHHLGFWGGGMVLSILGFAVLCGRDISSFLGNRAAKLLYDEQDESLLGPDYEKAEDEWNKGNFLEAIRLLREYQEANPREVHASLRIAEIYEKNLHNYLAAALEYEEILAKKLPPERWGWSAIHLCNLYNRLSQPDKALALLQRIDAEYGDTKAAEKARARLEQLAEEGVVQRPAKSEPKPPAPSTSPPDEPPPFQLPPGFRPK